MNEESEEEKEPSRPPTKHGNYVVEDRPKIKDIMIDEEEEEKKENKKEYGPSPIVSGARLVNEKEAKDIHSEPSTIQFKTDPFKTKALDEEDVLATRLDDEDTLERVRYYLQEHAEIMMGNILISLYKAREEKVCCLLLKHYKVTPKKEFIIRAAHNKSFLILKYIWKYSRNI